VFDNLIHRKELPQIVGVFVMPGVPLDSEGNRVTDRGKTNAQRSTEYDTLSPKFASFLEKELLPKVEKQYDIKFSTNPDDRAICGISSGGIAAFTVAWERPDLFRKVMSQVGSFTNIRVATSITIWFGDQRRARSLSASSCRMAAMIWITSSATGPSPTSRWQPR
jgi:enterochelin esterase-like enzyme